MQKKKKTYWKKKLKGKSSFEKIPIEKKNHWKKKTY